MGGGHHTYFVHGGTIGVGTPISDHLGPSLASIKYHGARRSRRQQFFLFETYDLILRLEYGASVPVGGRSADRLKRTSVATTSDIIYYPPTFFTFFSVVYFFPRRSSRIQKSYLTKDYGSAQKHRVNLFWILQALWHCWL